MRRGALGGVHRRRAMQRDRFREALESAGFQLEEMRENAGYRFISERASRASEKYGVASVSVLARKP